MSDYTIELMANRNNQITKDDLEGKDIQGCPFCGQDSISVEDKNGFFWLKCNFCEAKGPKGISGVSAIKAWQKRI